MSRKTVTKKEIVGYLSDSVYGYIYDTLVDTATHFGVLESPTNLRAIADFIAREVNTALAHATGSTKDDYWD